MFSELIHNCVASKFSGHIAHSKNNYYIQMTSFYRKDDVIFTSLIFVKRSSQ